MTVYVDNAFIPFRGMLMSHMMADDLDELHEMAAKLGLRRAWFQDGSIPHYDVSKGVRERAIKLGVVPEDAFSDSMKMIRAAQRAKQRERRSRYVVRVKRRTS